MNSTCKALNEFEISIQLIESTEKNELIKDITNILRTESSLYGVSKLEEDDLTTIYFSSKKEKPDWVPQFLWENFGYKRAYGGRIVLNGKESYKDINLEVAGIPSSKLDIIFQNFVKAGREELVSAHLVKESGLPRPLSQENFNDAMGIANVLYNTLNRI